MVKAYSYLRFSTPDQQRGDSERRQIEGARRYAAAHGLELDESTTYHDLGVSAFRGRNLEAGHLGQFLDAVRSGIIERGSYLLLESLDRLSRNKPRRAVRLLEEICEEGIKVVTIADGRVYDEDSLDDDPMAFMWAFMVAMRAHDESAMKSRRLAAAWQAKRAKIDEKPLTARCPAWLTLDPAKGRFVVVKDRAEVVKRIFRMAAKGVGAHKIAETLNRERVEPFGRSGFWHRSYVVKILASPAVTGRFVPHTATYEEGKKVRKPQAEQDGYFPKIIADDLFQRVQRAKDGARAPQRGRHAHSALTNVLGGLARCPVCGETMTRVSKGPKARAYMVCTKAKAGAGCRYRAVVYQDVENAVLQGYEAIADGCPSPVTQDRDIGRELRKLEGRLDELSDDIERLVDALRRGRSPALIEELRKCETEQDELQARRATLVEQREFAAGPLLKQRLQELKAALEAPEKDRAAINAVLRALLKGVTVNWKNGLLELEWAHGGDSTLAFAWPEGRSRKRAA